MNWFITSLVRTQFLEYDRKILHSSGILMDGLTCVYRCLLCGAAITIVLGCAIAGGFVACLAFYFSLTTGNVYVTIGAGIGAIYFCVYCCCCRFGYARCCNLL